MLKLRPLSPEPSPNSCPSEATKPSLRAHLEKAAQALFSAFPAPIWRKRPPFCRKASSRSLEITKPASLSAARFRASLSPRLFRGCARPFVGKSRPLAAPFRAGDEIRHSFMSTHSSARQRERETGQPLRCPVPRVPLSAPISRMRPPFCQKAASARCPFSRR